ncbi:hypothetical protein J4468_04335 [Candidatus Woesearchaeota archaeon]|nr:hypothetical protein [Candidatus Woesearchaeota archaeon]
MEKFWNKYIDADNCEREKLLKPVSDRLFGDARAAEKHKEMRRVFDNLLQSYFDDLIEVMMFRK